MKGVHISKLHHLRVKNLYELTNTIDTYIDTSFAGVVGIANAKPTMKILGGIFMYYVEDALLIEQYDMKFVSDNIDPIKYISRSLK